jgi:hypothetical protein
MDPTPETRDPEHGHPPTEEDRISTPTILWVGIGSLLVFLVASFATVSYLRMAVGERPPLPVPPEVGESKIGMVEQQLFQLSFRGERERAAKLEHLGSWGWVDRERGLLHMPIDRAMDLTVKGVRPPPGPAPAAAPPDIGG